jgi:hypothetical protein
MQIGWLMLPVGRITGETVKPAAPRGHSATQTATQSATE